MRPLLCTDGGADWLLHLSDCSLPAENRVRDLNL